MNAFALGEAFALGGQSPTLHLSNREHTSQESQVEPLEMSRQAGGRYSREERG